MRCLAKDRAARPADAGAVLAALDVLGSGAHSVAISARKPTHCLPHCPSRWPPTVLKQSLVVRGTGSLPVPLPAEADTPSDELAAGGGVGSPGRR
jgi:hypothetical protein